MSDIRRFTGFLAPDGSTHDTEKKAIEYTRLLKIRAALAERFKGFEVGEDGSADIKAAADFIFEQRAAILACLNPEVLTRKKRTPRVPKETKPVVAAPAAPAVVAPAAVAAPVAVAKPKPEPVAAAVVVKPTTPAAPKAEPVAVVASTGDAELDALLAS